MKDPRSYPSRPWLGVSALLHSGDKVVLVQRGNPPLEGVWSLPGGAVETGECLTDAIHRELYEELGLELHPNRLGELVEILREDEAGNTARHFVIAVFVAAIEEIPLQAGDDAAAAAWVPIDQIASYRLTDGTLDVIKRLLAGASLPHSAS